MQLLKRILWFCAGAKVDVLERCPSDHVKYSILGTSVLLTSVLAGLTGGGALDSVFDSRPAAVVFGLLWALLIFNFNRFVLSSMRSDQAWWQQALSALLRVCVAVLVAFIISIPLELQIFRESIREQIETEDRRLAEEEVNKKAADDSAKLSRAIDLQRDQLKALEEDLQRKKDALSTEITDAERRRDELVEKITNAQKQRDTAGTSRQTRRELLNAISSDTKELKKEKDFIAAKVSERDEITSKITNLKLPDENMAKVEPTPTPQIAEAATKPESKYSLLRQLIAFNNMQHQSAGGVGGQGNAEGEPRSSHDLFIGRYREQVANTTFWAAWFLRLVLIFIETGPVFIKLFTKSSKYDRLMAEMDADDEQAVADKHLVARFNQQLRRAAEKAMREGSLSVEEFRQMMSYRLAYDRGRIVLSSDLETASEALPASPVKEPLEVINQTIGRIQTLLREPADVDGALRTVSELLQRIEDYLTPALGSDEALGDILKDLEKLPVQIRSANIRRSVPQRS